MILKWKMKTFLLGIKFRFSIGMFIKEVNIGLDFECAFSTSRKLLWLPSLGTCIFRRYYYIILFHI
jgi:hypothetical protein